MEEDMIEETEEFEEEVNFGPPADWQEPDYLA